MLGKSKGGPAGWLVGLALLLLADGAWAQGIGPGTQSVQGGGTGTTSQSLNGVCYYDGTKITCGTALSFDGSTLVFPNTLLKYPGIAYQRGTIAGYQSMSIDHGNPFAPGIDLYREFLCWSLDCTLSISGSVGVDLDYTNNNLWGLDTFAAGAGIANGVSVAVANGGSGWTTGDTATFDIVDIATMNASIASGVLTVNSITGTLLPYTLLKGTGVPAFTAPELYGTNGTTGTGGTGTYQLSPAAAATTLTSRAMTTNYGVTPVTGTVTASGGVVSAITITNPGAFAPQLAANVSQLPTTITSTSGNGTGLQLTVAWGPNLATHVAGQSGAYSQSGNKIYSGVQPYTYLFHAPDALYGALAVDTKTSGGPAIGLYQEGTLRSQFLATGILDLDVTGQGAAAAPSLNINRQFGLYSSVANVGTVEVGYVDFLKWDRPNRLDELLVAGQGSRDIINTTSPGSATTNGCFRVGGYDTTGGVGHDYIGAQICERTTNAVSGAVQGAVDTIVKNGGSDATVTSATSAGLNVKTGSLSINNNALVSPTAPTIASGGCTTGSAQSITANGTAGFTITLGGATCGSTVTLTMPSGVASHGWSCSAHNRSNGATNYLDSASASTTSVVFTNYVRTTGVAGNFTGADVVDGNCTPV